MTAIIVIENIDIEKEVTITDDILKAYGSAIYIEVGEKIKIKDLLYGLMLQSGNDAAIALAIATSGSMEDFVKLMNSKVLDLELENTIFVNNHGLEEQSNANYSSAYDMAIITKYAMENDLFREIFSTENYSTKSSYKSYSWHNKNKILNHGNYINGGKTGYTDRAKRTLVTTASKDNIDLIVVTLNDGNDWADHISLYEKVFANYTSVKILDKDLTSLKNEDKDLYIKNDYNILLNNNEDNKINIKYELYNEAINEVAGIAKIYLDDNLIHEEKIYLYTPLKKSLWDKIVEWFKLW